MTDADTGLILLDQFDDSQRREMFELLPGPWKACWWVTAQQRKCIAIQADHRAGVKGTVFTIETTSDEEFQWCLLVARWIVHCRSVETADVDKQLLSSLEHFDRAMAGCRENEDRIRKHFRAEMETLHKGIEWRDRRIEELEQQLAKMPVKQASLFGEK